MCKAMIHFGISKLYVNLLKNCNYKTLFNVCFLQKVLPAFEVNSGLRKGDVLSSILFNLGLKNAIRDSYVNRRMKVIDNETVLAYADDIILLGNT